MTGRASVWEADDIVKFYIAPLDFFQLLYKWSTRGMNKAEDSIFLKKYWTIRYHVLRERPFNLKGGGGGDYVFFLFFFFKYSDSQCCWKKYSDFGGGKNKYSDSEFLSYNLMWNYGKKFRALRDKKVNILTLVLSEKKILNETKNHNPPPPPPLQVKWSVP